MQEGLSLGTEKQRPIVSMHVCTSVWKRESKGKGFTEDDNIIEKKVRNTYLCCHKKRTKIFPLNEITV